MMHLSAESAGERANLAKFRGRIHSVFDRACNLADDAGIRLVLLAPALGQVPHGVMVQGPADLSFFRLLRQDQPVGLRGGVLYLGDAITVDVRGARIWRSGLHHVAVDLTRPNQRQAWRVAWRTVRQELSARPEWGSLFERRLLGAADSFRQSAPAAAAADLAALIGCGPGLTPAGDDFVVGYLAGVWCGAVDAVRDIHTAVIASVETTTEISRSYLHHAAAGYAAEPLRTLAGCIAGGAGTEATEAAAKSACSVGATSGVAGVLGLLCGLDASCLHA